jgi:hypothetical protein
MDTYFLRRTGHYLLPTHYRCSRRAAIVTCNLRGSGVGSAFWAFPLAFTRTLSLPPAPVSSAPKNRYPCSLFASSLPENRYPCSLHLVGLRRSFARKRVLINLINGFGNGEDHTMAVCHPILDVKKKSNSQILKIGLSRCRKGAIYMVVDLVGLR